VSDAAYIDYGGEIYFLGMNQPLSLTTSFEPLVTAPNFTVWTKSQIEDAIRNKPVKRREQFRDKKYRINQRQRGSCASAATLLSKYRAMVLGGWNEFPLLSWEFLYAQVNGGQDRGSLLEDNMKAVMTTGVAPLDTQRHPINRDIDKSDYTPEEYREAQKYRAVDCRTIDTELELATLLLSGAGAAVVAVDVDGSFMQMDRNGIAGGGNGVGNHAVCVDDVDIINGELAFDNDGSWGENVHDGGRVYLTWKRHFHKTPKYHRFFALLAASNPGDGGPVVPA